MAQTFTFELVSPEKVLLAGEAEQVAASRRGRRHDHSSWPFAADLDAAAGRDRRGAHRWTLAHLRAPRRSRRSNRTVLTVLAEKAQDVAEPLGRRHRGRDRKLRKPIWRRPRPTSSVWLRNQAIAALSRLRS